MFVPKKIIARGFTYDDVLLVPAYSEVLPRAVCLRTRFTRSIALNVPIISAAMDTVTESHMAIAMAREGGIGVLHKNMSVAKQAEEVRKVKRSESGMILDPITATQEQTVGEAKETMATHGIGGIPVVDSEGRLVGIVTNRDLRFEREMNKPLSAVMTTTPLITTTEKTSLEAAEIILQRHKIEKLPVVKSDNTLVGLITYRDIMKVKQHPRANKDSFGRLRVAAALGITEDVLERADCLVAYGVDALVLDTAHAHTQGVVGVLKRLKAAFPKMDVVVGNIATSEAAKYLINAGADALKVGIGPGSICTTRIVAGVGFPQLSAVMEVAGAVAGSGVPVIADGGIRYTGDIAKAIAAGADSVMLGSLLAGTEEAPGEMIIFENRRFKAYRGMGSVEAMQAGSKDRYFQGGALDSKKLVPEGIVGRVPYKGVLRETMHQFVGGLRSAMGYCGAKDLPTMQTARFVEITQASMRESHPHDVIITKEAPNYSV